MFEGCKKILKDGLKASAASDMLESRLCSRKMSLKSYGLCEPMIAFHPEPKQSD